MATHLDGMLVASNNDHDTATTMFGMTNFDRNDCFTDTIMIMINVIIIIIVVVMKMNT
jgi:hypothetical protein